MANLGTTLVSIYQSYSTGLAKAAVAGSQSSASAAVADQLAAKFPTIEFQNGMVGLSSRAWGVTSASS